MPDADDFDVEYFRNLLKGISPQTEPAPLAGTAPPVAGRPPQRPAKPAAAAKKGRPAAGRKKGGK